MCKVRAQAFVMNVCIYMLETNVLVSIGDSCIWAKTEGFSAQNTSPNLEEESKMSCEGGWAKAAYIWETGFLGGEHGASSQRRERER